MLEPPERSSMKRLELNEIKKQFTPAGCTIDRIAGCIANDEGEAVYEIKENFLYLPEEMMFKFFEIFRKGLSGRKGKNIYSLEFKEDSRAKASLQHIRQTGLKDEETNEILFENIIDYCSIKGYSAIFVIHGIYDIPGKGTDNEAMEDASEEVYEYIMTAICPVTLSKPGLSWNREEGTMGEANRQWMIQMPSTAFLYPAFTDRSQDLDHVWFYTKNANDPEKALIDQVLGCKMFDTPSEQKEEFKRTVKGGERCTYSMEQVKDLYRELQTLAENQKDSEEPITAEQIAKIVRKYGIESEGTETEISLQNVINLSTMEIGTPDAHITVSTGWEDMVDIKEAEGERYITVRAGGAITVNGIEV